MSTISRMLSGGAWSWSADSKNITVTFQTNTTSGTNNVQIRRLAEVV